MVGDARLEKAPRLQVGVLFLHRAILFDLAPLRRGFLLPLFVIWGRIQNGGLMSAWSIGAGLITSSARISASIRIVGTIDVGLPARQIVSCLER